MSSEHRTSQNHTGVKGDNTRDRTTNSSGVTKSDRPTLPKYTLTPGLWKSAITTNRRNMPTDVRFTETAGRHTTWYGIQQLTRPSAICENYRSYLPDDCLCSFRFSLSIGRICFYATLHTYPIVTFCLVFMMKPALITAAMMCTFSGCATLLLEERVIDQFVDALEEENVPIGEQH